jgi:GNAT superfamily N-acetyltransferase
MKLELLADDPDSHKTVAKWYFDEWVSAIPGVTIDRVENKLSKAINRDSAPLIVLAKHGDELIGAAELKRHEMDIYPNYEYWLGGVYVKNTFRQKGVGKALTQDVMARAKSLGIRKLYLQTESLNGGLYQRCGFEGIEEVDYKGHRVLVMVAELDA